MKTRYRMVWLGSLGLSAIALGCSASDVSASGSGSSIGAGGGAANGGAAGAVGNAGSAGTGVAGGGGTSVIVTGPISGGQGGGTLNADAACLAQAQQGEQRPIALLFMVDNSQSMNTVDRGQTQSRWNIIRAAVPAFLSAPENAGLWVGLDFFSEPLRVDAGGGGQGNNNTSCNVVDYENLNVPVDVLPGGNNAQVNALTTAINTRVVQGNTPTTPALQGAISSAATWQSAHPEQNVFVVFVTDGQPNGCNSSVANAAAAAAAGVLATPSIKTYVLGVGVEVGNLDAIAVGGGTGPTAYLVTSGGAAALTAALNTIKGTAVACDYKVPDLSGRLLDFTQINVQSRVGSQGNQVLLGRVDNAAACGTGDGWYYDQPVVIGGPPPTTITLCPSTCDPLKTTPGSELQVLIGCKTITRIQ
jgi:hypothetical protein